LWARLVEYVREAAMSGAVEMVLVDGSLLTAKPDPNDIDLALFCRQATIFQRTSRRRNTTFLRKNACEKRLDLIFWCEEWHDSLEHAVAFFQQVRQRPV